MKSKSNEVIKQKLQPRRTAIKNQASRFYKTAPKQYGKVSSKLAAAFQSQQRNIERAQRLRRQAPIRRYSSTNVHEQNLQNMQENLNQLNQFRKDRMVNEGYFQRKNQLARQEEFNRQEFLRKTNLMSTKLVVDKSANNMLKPEMFKEEPTMSLFTPFGNGETGIEGTDQDFHLRMKEAGRRFHGQ
jgi:hypothetical protein